MQNTPMGCGNNLPPFLKNHVFDDFADIFGDIVYFLINCISKNRTLSSTFETKCYRQNDRSNRVII